jgi:mono/diheme cytochrome c family protein
MQPSVLTTALRAPAVPPAGARSGRTAKEDLVTKLVPLIAVGLLAACGAKVGLAQDTGARLYLNHCAACHGDDGEGTGPVAASMRVTVPNLRSLAQRNGGVYPADAVAAYVDGRTEKAAHGDRQMPIWGDVFKGVDQDAPEQTVRRRIAAVVEFIATLQYPQRP